LIPDLLVSLIRPPENKFLQMNAIFCKPLESYVISVGLSEIVNFFRSEMSVRCKIIKDCKVQDKVTLGLQARVSGNFFELFKIDSLIPERVADDGTDKAFFIPDCKAEKIPLDRITYLIQINGPFRLRFYNGVLLSISII
jgi:hypothetical protein